MSNNLAVRLYPEVLRTLGFASISGTYAAIGSALLYPSRILYVVNTTDVLLTFSFDGINAHFVIPSQAFLIIDAAANTTINAGSATFAQGQKIYVEGSPTSGSVYLTSFYGSGAL